EASIPAPPKVGLVARTGVDFAKDAAAAPLDKIVAEHTRGNAAVSSTGELRHDPSAGRFEVDTPRTQGFAGFRSDAPIALGNVRIESKTPFAAVVVTALDDAPIAASKHWLVTAAANAVNTGMALAPSGNGLADPGHSPILVEPVEGSVGFAKLGGSLDHLTAYALGASGERGSEVPLMRTRDGFILTLSPTSKTLHYEIVRK
ncbi:MAG TPA: hypothetical protein VFQ35_27865, partial [Polyangiaceae bacterium]|nr:hypothetical protein [Polyangiaceae bacterium]